MSYRVYLSKVIPPKVCSLPSLLRLVTEETERNSHRRYKTQARILSARDLSAAHVLEGLLNVARAMSWGPFGSDEILAVLSVPTSNRAYAHGIFKDYSHVAINEVIRAMEGLGLIERQPGGYAGDHNFQTAIWPTQKFADAAGDQIYGWRPPQLVKDNLVRLKNYDAAERKGYQIPFSPTPATRAMAKNVLRINKALRGCAISLQVDEFLLWWVRRLMSQENYRREHDFAVSPRLLDLHRVQLHRSFVRKRFDRGGRFHGGWWECIPSRYRRFITINGKPTVEYDYSAMHPRLMYAEFGETPPEGDLYDFGYAGPKPEQARAIYKFVVNAVINADSRGFLIPKADQELLRMTQPEIISRVIAKHPLLARIRGKGYGLKYQFIESEVAEAVLIRLLDLGIVCLPVHDSFLVTEEYAEELKQAMECCYTKIVGVAPVIKPPEVAQSDFEPAILPSGEPDLHYLCNLQATSTVRRFLTGFASKQGEGTHIALSERNVLKTLKNQ